MANPRKFGVWLCLSKWLHVDKGVVWCFLCIFITVFSYDTVKNASLIYTVKRKSLDKQGFYAYFEIVLTDVKGYTFIPTQSSQAVCH